MSDQEVNRVFSWRPYRDDWTVDRNKRDDNIESYYGELIHNLTKNPSFDTYYSEGGGLGNYLEFFCYPEGHRTYTGNAILVCVSLCAPIAAYGQTTLNKQLDFIGFGSIFRPEERVYVTPGLMLIIDMQMKIYSKAWIYSLAGYVAE